MINYENAFTFEELFRAAIECSKGVKWKFSVIDYLLNIEKRTSRLVRDLKTNRYRISEYDVFKIYEPKVRIIRSIKFRDRVVQRSLCNNGLYDELTKGFIYDSCACLKGRGTTFAFTRIKKHLQYHFRHHGLTGWVLRIDISKFFDSIPHSVAKSVIDKRISNAKVRSMIHDIIDSFKDQRDLDLIFSDPFGERGIGLGSQISQILALAVLDPIDHYVKDICKVKCYIRYMDDLVIIHQDKEFLKTILTNIKHQLEQIGLTLNKKTSISKLQEGVKFLKRKHILTKTGKVITLISKNSVNKEKRKLYKLRKLLNEGQITIEDVVHQFSGWIAYIEKTCSNTKILNMYKLYVKLFET